MVSCIAASAPSSPTSEISWIDWEGIGDGGGASSHSWCGYAGRSRWRGRFLSGAYNEELEVKDVTWLTASGAEMTAENWEDANARSLGVLLDGRAQETGIRRRGTDVTFYLVLNTHIDVVKFTLPKTVGGRGWILRIDTNQSNENDAKTFRFDHQYEVTGPFPAAVRAAAHRQIHVRIVWKEPLPGHAV
jgi:isoamylase